MIVVCGFRGEVSMSRAAIVLGLVTLLAVPAIADSSVPPPTPSSAAATQDDPWLKEVTCRKMAPPTGTLLGARKVCQTNKEWRDQTMQAQRYVSGMQQRLSGASNPHETP